jgi:arylsulfatase
MIAHGGSFGGYSFYIYEGKLCYVYNWLGQQQQKITCPLSNLADKENTLKVVFNKKPNQQPDSKFGGSTIGEVQLYINDIKQQNTTIEEAFPEYPDQFLTQPGKFGAGFNIGRDPGQPVSSDYEHEFEFFEFEGAKLKKVIVTIKNDAGAGAIDPETELIGMLWRD